MQRIICMLLLTRIFAQPEPQQIQVPDSMPIQGQYADDSMPFEASEIGGSTTGQNEQVRELMPVQSPQIQDDNPSEPYPILRDLLNSVGVDSIGPDQPGGYGSGITGQTSPDGADMGSGGDAVDQVLDQQKQQIQQQQAEKAANEYEGAPSPQQQGQAHQQRQPQVPGPGQSDPTNGMLGNNPINPAIPGMGPQLGSLPNANNAFGIPSIPPIADFTLPPTPPAPSEMAKSKDEAKNASPIQQTLSPESPTDDSSRTFKAVIIGFSVGGAVLFGCLAGIGLMWIRHKRQEASTRVSPPV